MCKFTVVFRYKNADYTGGKRIYASRIGKYQDKVKLFESSTLKELIQTLNEYKPFKTNKQYSTLIYADFNHKPTLLAANVHYSHVNKGHNFGWKHSIESVFF